MRHVYVSDARKELAFAVDAAKCFAADPKITTYTDGEITAGCLFAIRWGLGDDSVLVLKLDECFTPIVYGQAVRTEAP